MQKLLDNLQINREIISNRVKENKNAHSSFDLHTLLPFFQGTREDLYLLIQKTYFESDSLIEVRSKLQAALVAQKIPENVWTTLNGETPSMRHHDEVFDRVFKLYPL